MKGKAQKKTAEPETTIPKDEAVRRMKEKGYTCTLIDGVLQFGKRPENPKALKKLVQDLEDIGYHASWGF